MEMSAKNSECIVALLKHVSSDAYIMQKFLRSFKEDKVWLPSNATKMTCPHCFLIPRFPLVLKCGYVSSYRCFPEWFKHSREPNLNYSRATVVLEDVMTLHNERLKRPSSLTAKMYDLAMMMCNNIRCTKKLNIDQMNNYEFYDCPFRIIKCSANTCLYISNPNGIHKHALEYPFLIFYCSTCNSDYGS